MKRFFAMILACIMLVLFTNIPAVADSADMAKVSVAWDLSNGKTVTCSARYAGLDRAIPIQFRLSGMTDEIIENGSRRITFVVTATNSFVPTEEEISIIGNANVDGYIGFANSIAWTFNDYESGYNVENENQHHVESTSERLSYESEHYEAADGSWVNITRKFQHYCSVTFPRDYDGLCIRFLGSTEAFSTDKDELFWEGKAPFSETSYHSGSKKDLSHFMRVRAADAPEPDQNLIDLSNVEISLIKDQPYTGKAVKPSVALKYSGKKLEEEKDYTVTCYNNKAIGQAKAVITGTGHYTGTAVLTFRIIPKTVKLSSVTAGKKKLTIKWRKDKAVDGYEIQYSLKSNFKKATTVTISKASKTSQTIKNLKSGKSYYVRIRAFKIVNDEMYYSAWSDKKKIKVK